MPMKFEKVREAVSKCAMLLEDHGVHSHRYEEPVVPPNERQMLQHALWMCLETLTWGEARREKAMRWLGFVQGVLWACRFASIDRLKAMNKPDDEGEEQHVAASEDVGRADTDRVPAPGNLPRIEPDSPTTVAPLPVVLLGGPDGGPHLARHPDPSGGDGSVGAGLELTQNRAFIVGAVSSITGLNTRRVERSLTATDLDDFFLVAVQVRATDAVPCLGRLMTALMKEREKYQEGDPGDGDNVF